MFVSSARTGATSECLFLFLCLFVSEAARQCCKGGEVLCFCLFFLFSASEFVAIENGAGKCGSGGFCVPTVGGCWKALLRGAHLREVEWSRSVTGFSFFSYDFLYLVALRSRVEERLQQFWSSLGAANWGERSRRSLFLGSPELVDHEERRNAAERR